MPCPACTPVHLSNLKLMRHLLFLLALPLLWHCQSKPTPNAAAPAAATTLQEVVAMVKTTHAEARDTLRIDTTAPLKKLLMTTLPQDTAWKVLSGLKLGSVFMADWPDNGFYGDDRRRIEFIFTSFERSFNDPFVYAVTGKNRYKTTISDFSGIVHIKEVARFKDPNLEQDELEDLGLIHPYALRGEFRFDEDRSLTTSGQFAGTFRMDMALNGKGVPSLWFFSKDTPAGGSGYRFDGHWTSYRNAASKKPVIWSRDLFSFANDILADFSYGERDIEINPQYRHLGWDTFWDGEEWWHGDKKKM